VRKWIEHPEQLRVLEKTYQSNAITLSRLRELVKAGKITDELQMFAASMLDAVSGIGTGIAAGVLLA
jgi:hypothetical protein